jgi:predicted enzyme related to lactoylglutathione lyase
MQISAEKINYVEFPATDLDAARTFFARVFGWVFTDYGKEYTAFSHREAGLDGGFFYAQHTATTSNGSALIVFYSEDLTATQNKIVDSGGSISREIFSFPGGKRFHFNDPNGNEYAVWSDG